MNEKNNLPGQELFEAVGQLDDRFVEEAAAPESTRKASKKIIPFASLVAVAAAVALLVSPFGQNGLRYLGLIGEPDSGNGQTDSPSSFGSTDEYYVNSTELDYVILCPWSDLPDSERWSSFTLSGEEYLRHFISNRPLDPSRIGKSRSEITLVGYDEVTGEKHTKKAEAFEIKNVAPDCALAVLYDDGNYRTYILDRYAPDTLGQMVRDLGLRHYLKVGNVYCSYMESDAWVTDTYSGLKAEKLLELFDEYASAECETGEGAFSNKKLVNWYDISITIEELGHNNISVSFTQNGYMITNIMDIGKVVYVGEDTAKEFFELIKGSCTKSTERRPVNVGGDVGEPIQDGQAEPFYGAASSAYTGPN